MNSQYLQTILVVGTVGLPLLMILALAFRRGRVLIPRLTPLACLPALFLVFFGGAAPTLELPWLLKHTLLQLDPVGRVFLGFSSVLWLAAGWYAVGYLAGDAKRAQFTLFFLLSMCGNFGLILAGNVPTFFVSFALMGLASAGLVMHVGDVEALRAGRIYLSLAMLGEVLLLTGFIFQIAAAGTMRIDELHRAGISTPAIILLALGFGIKAGALTLHFWLPLAHPAAPVPASAVLSGAMIKSGLLGWIRFLPLGEATMSSLGFVFVVAGLAAAFFGVFFGLAQKNAKTVLAYSSVSQMGLITTGVGIAALQPGTWTAVLPAILVYATHHALSKGALFLGIGVTHAVVTLRQKRLVQFGLVLPALALAGAPFTSGALAKVALKSKVAYLPPGWSTAADVLLPLAAVGTTLLMARFLWLVWPQAADRLPLKRGLWLPWTFMVLAVMGGVWLLPGALSWVPLKFTPLKIWSATWPLVLGGGLAVLGHYFTRWFSREYTRWLPPGDMAVFIETLLQRLRTPEAHGHQEHEQEEKPFWMEHYLCRISDSARCMEARMCAWPFAGCALLLLIAVLLFTLRNK